MMSTWCSKHVEAWNKLIVKQKFCASSWLITEIKPMYVLYNCLISISFTTWRWPLSIAETCSCILCRKYFIFYTINIVVLDQYTHCTLVILELKLFNGHSRTIWFLSNAPAMQTSNIYKVLLVKIIFLIMFLLRIGVYKIYQDKLQNCSCNQFQQTFTLWYKWRWVILILTWV